MKTKKLFESGYYSHKAKRQFVYGALLILGFVSVYVTGILVFKTPKTYFSVMAALLVLPAAQMLARGIALLNTPRLGDEDLKLLAPFDAPYLLKEVKLITEKGVLLIEAIFVAPQSLYLYMSKPTDDIKAYQDWLKAFFLERGHALSIHTTDQIHQLVAIMDHLRPKSYDVTQKSIDLTQDGLKDIILHIEEISEQ